MKKIFAITLIFFSYFSAFVDPLHAEGDESCASEYIIAPSSGAVLFEKDSETPRPPASMTKLMTAYVVYRQVKEGALKWDDILPVSARASKIGGSQVYLKEGEQFTLAQLFEAMMIQSANDAATAIAERIAGTEEAFAVLMNKQAQTLGMTKSTFVTPHGLPPSKGQAADLASAKDFAILASALIKDFPEVLNITSKDVSTFRNGTFEMRNHNHMLHTFNGVDGLKTGYYDSAGFCISVTAQRAGARLLGIFMNCSSRKARDDEAAKQLSVGFTKVQSIDITSLPQVTAAKAPVSGGLQAEVSLIPEHGLSLTMPKEQIASLQVNVERCMNLAAPIQKGTGCGSVSFQLGNKEVGRVGLVSSADDAAAGILDKAKQSMGW